MTYLTLNPSVLLAPIEGGCLAYDLRRGSLHRLNPKGALIAELCDGRRTLDDVCGLAASLESEQPARDLRAWIEEGVDAGLFLEKRNGVESDYSARRLGSVAEKLRAEDKVEAAFVCQYRAAELDPKNPSRWATLGEFAHICGIRDAAKYAYERCLELEPDDAEVRHLLAALNGTTPPRVPNECIEQLYSRFSEFYEKNMHSELDYRGPEQLYETAKPLLSDRTDLRVLDLGCGSGLGGVRFRKHAREMEGIDLSKEMIGLARQRGIYDRLETAEITKWLSPARGRYDLIIACDALIYFGDLGEVLSGAAPLLAADGVMAFSVERGEQAPFHLDDSGRFTHHPDHVREAAGRAGLAVEHSEEAFLRMEYGREVVGLFSCLRPTAR